ncbi:hypothetical protein [Corallococcus sp. AB038B]|uniref:hypothetical protein n=1 Tax=Corallococcus sp. AB038B TaxID=2316718 RepID=UPI000EE8D6E3|nr:hypothetical protein [Corallococcus sp. AB038B]RKH92986.1 hypothetical protein D7Y04_41940 [Corallococcus sp. AB038B]
MKRPTTAVQPLDPRLAVEQLKPLAVAFDDARTTEVRLLTSWHESGSRLNTKTHQDLIAAQDNTFRARRALADAIFRVLVRGHVVDCTCATCSTEHNRVGDLVVPFVPPAQPPRGKG